MKQHHYSVKEIVWWVMNHNFFFFLYSQGKSSQDSPPEGAQHTPTTGQLLGHQHVHHPESRTRNLHNDFVKTGLVKYKTTHARQQWIYWVC